MKTIEKTMNISLAAAIALFTEMGFDTSKWTAARCLTKIKTLPSWIDDHETPPTSKEGKSLLKKISATLEASGEVTIVPDATEKPAKGAKGKGAKASKTEVVEEAEDEAEDDDEEAEGDEEEGEDDAEEEEEDDEEVEEEEEADEEEVEEKPAKGKGKGKAKASADKGKAATKDAGDKKKPGGNFKRAGGENGPGVIASIVEFLGEGTAEKPVSKADILKKLLKRFPDRDETSMRATINTQIPNRLAKEKGLNIKSNDSGYWISKKAKKEGK